jgi:diguanylate cyclase (GGDEF)-like protein
MGLGRWAEDHAWILSRLASAAVLAGLVLGLYRGPLRDGLEPVERWSRDWRFHLRKAERADDRILLVELDRKSAQAVGAFPWKRSEIARLVRALAEFDTRAIALDVDWGDERPEADAELAQAIAAAGNVYLGVIARGPAAGDYVFPPKECVSAARGLGHTAATRKGARTRSVPAEMTVSGRSLWQLGLLTAYDLLDAPLSEVRAAPGAVEVRPRNGLAFGIPLDGGELVLNWPGPWEEAFQRVSAADVLEAAERKKAGSAPSGAETLFRDKVCLVGVTVPGHAGNHETALGGAWPDIALHATVVNSVLRRDFLVTSGSRAEFEILVLLCVLFGLAFLIRRYAAAFLWTLAVGAAYAGTGAAYFLFGNAFLPVGWPALATAAALAALTAEHQVTSFVEGRRLMHLVVRDALSGLYNFEHFKMILEAELRGTRVRRDKAVSLIMADLDHFKEVNDTFGHPAGDEVIRRFSHILRRNCRSLDIACRYGGEEFLLMLPGARLEDAGRIAEKIRRAFEAELFQLGDEKAERRLTVSLGVASYYGRETATELIARADRALYMAKQGGRNLVCRI